MFYGGGVHFPSDSKSTLFDAKSSIVEVSLDSPLKEMMRRGKDNIRKIDPILFNHDAAKHADDDKSPTLRQLQNQADHT